MLLSRDGRPGLFLAFYIDPDWARRRRDLPAAAPLFSTPAITLEPWLHQAAANLLDHLSDNESVDDVANYEIERFIDSVLDAADASSPQDGRARVHTMQADFRVRKAIAADEGQCLRAHLLRRGGAQRRPVAAAFLRAVQGTDEFDAQRLLEHLAHGGGACGRCSGREESLTSVACNLGFTTQGNFTRFFRDHAGVPPTLYREAARAIA